MSRADSVVQAELDGLELIAKMNERLLMRNQDVNSSFHSKFSKGSKTTTKSRRFTIEVSLKHLCT